MNEASSDLAPATLPAPGKPGVLYIVDISGYVFRAFFALPPLTSPKGEPTGAIYGVTSMLLKLVREQKPHMLAVVMDSKGPSFRHAVYSEYKANRPAAPPDLARQMAHVKEVAQAYAIPCYTEEGAEADDLIASLTHEARRRGHEVVIVSADKDLLQLVGEGVLMLDTMRDRAFGPAETVEKMGVRPEQVRDFLALTGDSSDNVPGVPSVGPKTAADLLKEYGSLEGIYEHLGEIKKKALKQKLEDNRELAMLSQKLVTLKDDMPVHYDEQALVYGGYNEDDLRAFYTAYGFTRLLDQLGPSKKPMTAHATAHAAMPERAAPKQPRQGRLRIVEEHEELPDVVRRLRHAAPIAVFCAVEREEPVHGGLVGIGLCGSDGHGVYLPVGHAYLGCPKQLPMSAVAKEVGELLADASVPKLSSNLKRDVIALARNAMKLEGAVFDTMLASYLIDPDLRGHGIAEIMLRHDERILPSYEVTCGKGKTEKPLYELSAEEVLPYALANTLEVLHAYDFLAAELDKANLLKVLTELEMPMAYVLAHMEQTGIRCDADKLRELSRKVDKELIRLEKKCFELVGHEFNVNSPRQLETILFDELALPVVERTKTSRSTNADVLEELAILHPLPETILEHRSLAKLKGTYLDALPREIRPTTGRIHTRFDQAVAATGRISSNEPNLQNIPIRTEIGREIRDAFVPREGFQIFAADYSQIELRVLAHLSQDEALLEAFRENADVHVRTAQALFSVPAEGVTRDMRAAAKTVNFAVIYGQTQFALARNLRIPRGEAQKHIKSFFARYHGVRRYLDALVQEARETGAVRTLMGRRRLVRDINAKNHNVRSGAERIAQNTPIQGSAADILKTAMIRVQRALDDKKLESRMLLTVHDELVFEAPKDEHKELERLVRDAMEGAAELSVPLVVGTGWGESWGAAH